MTRKRMVGPGGGDFAPSISTAGGKMGGGKSIVTGKKSSVSKKTKEKLKEKKKGKEKDKKKAAKRKEFQKELSKLKSDKGVDKEEYWGYLTPKDQAREIILLRKRLNYYD